MALETELNIFWWCQWLLGKKFHTVGPAQVLTWHYKTVSVIENLLPHSTYISYVPRTVLGLRIAKLEHVISLLTHPISLDLHWFLPSLPRWRETGVSWPGGCSWSFLPSHLQLFGLPLAPVPPLFIQGGEKNSGRRAPQSGLVTSDIPLDDLLSLDFCFAVYMVHFNTHCFVIWHAPTVGSGDAIFRDHFSIERCYRWCY